MYIKCEKAWHHSYKMFLNVQNFTSGIENHSWLIKHEINEKFFMVLIHVCVTRMFSRLYSFLHFQMPRVCNTIVPYINKSPADINQQDINQLNCAMLHRKYERILIKRYIKVFQISLSFINIGAPNAFDLKYCKICCLVYKYPTRAVILFNIAQAHVLLLMIVEIPKSARITITTLILGLSALQVSLYSYQHLT